MSVNRKREILDLLENGKIDAEEAAAMLSGMSAGAESVDAPAETVEIEIDDTPAVTKTVDNAAKKGRPSTFHVRVRNLDTGENKVTVNIPLRMLKFGLKLGGRFSPELEGIDLDEVNEMMSGFESGVLVEVQNEESNEHVQVYID